MTIAVKICGITEPREIAAMAEAQADFVGFVYYPRSKRHLTAEQLAPLAEIVPPQMQRVLLMVNPTDKELAAMVTAAKPDYLQLHGEETPSVCAELKETTGLKIIKAIGIAEAADLALAENYAGIADILLFDAKPAPGAMHGGNGLRFDWPLMAGYDGSTPWMLSGGLTADNVALARKLTGAQMFDVSSGVENETGKKDATKITGFIQAARTEA
jgi:phosphoribosylanthranilate isomerase